MGQLRRWWYSTRVYVWIWKCFLAHSGTIDLRTGKETYGLKCRLFHHHDVPRHAAVGGR